jgi:hypothetical protein
MTSFLDIVRLAATSPDNELRKENELKLLMYRSAEPNSFLSDLMVNFEKPSTEPALKQAIAAIAKSSFANEIVARF